MDQLRALSTFWPGVGFDPTDKQLIYDYLKRKVHGENFEHDIIPEIDVYKYAPWELPAKCNVPTSSENWHFFTPREKRDRGEPAYIRTTKEGYWQRCKTVYIMDMEKVIGTKVTFYFFKGNIGRYTIKTEWAMHEYSLDKNECEDVAPESEDRIVICQVFKIKELDQSDADPSNDLVERSGMGEPGQRNGMYGNNKSNDNNKCQKQHIEKSLQQKFCAFKQPSHLDARCSAAPVGPIPAAPVPEPEYYSLGEGFEDKEDIRSLLSMDNQEYTQNL